MMFGVCDVIALGIVCIMFDSIATTICKYYYYNK